MGQMNRAIAREGDDRQKQDRFASTLVIAARNSWTQLSQSQNCPKQ
jgi:hypothetical protein